MPKPSIKTGCDPRFWRKKRWDTYPEKGFYISWPLNSIRHHSDPVWFVSARIKSLLTHQRAKKKLKKTILRCLPPGPVCASPQNTEAIYAWPKLFPCIASTELISISGKPFSLNAVWSCEVNNQDRPYLYEYSVHV